MLDKLMTFWSKLIKKHTNFMIRDLSDYENVITLNKKLVIIFWHPLCRWCQKIMMTLPYVYLKLKIKWYNLKFCNIRENLEVQQKLEIKKTPTLCIYEESKIINRIEEEKEVIKFLY